jgi:hypothetical protein
MLMNQQHFEGQVEELKRASVEKFDAMIEFTHDDINN